MSCAFRFFKSFFTDLTSSHFSGVNLSEPSVSCFPKDAYRDRYSLLTNQALETTSDQLQNLRLVDSMNSAILSACKEIYGDLPSYLSTAFVVRDIDALREALGEEVLNSYFVSYGTGIGQHYSQMFPNRVGRMMLDGVENAMRDRRAEWFSKSVSLPFFFHPFRQKQPDSFVLVFSRCSTTSPTPGKMDSFENA